MTAPARRSAWRELPFLVVLAVGLALVLKAVLVQAFSIPSGSMEKTLHGCEHCQGDRVLVNKLVYDVRGIHRGEIVVFNGSKDWAKDGGEGGPAPKRGTVGSALHHVGVFFGVASDDKDYIKRVIGLPGDRVMCCSPRGNVVVTPPHGKPVELVEPYVYNDAPDQNPLFCAAAGAVTQPDLAKKSCVPGAQGVLVPKGRLFVMGDHRNDSSDSRYHFDDGVHGTISEKDVVGRAFVVVWPPKRWKVLGVPTTFTSAVGTPPVLALAGAVPITLLRRRRKLRA